MDQVKRKLIFNQSLKEETKKLRNDSNQSITYIENFSNEFFYEIFDYLDCYEIYEAFSNLNYRFQQLINSPSLLFKIKLDYSEYNKLYMNNYKQFLLLNKHKILSIKLCSGYGKDNFFSSFTIDSSLIRLESLFVQLKQSNILQLLLIKLSCLPRLFSLTIEPWIISENLNDIYRLIFILPALKFCKFILNRKHGSISLPMSTNQQFSTIEYLAIYHSCTFNELFTILSYTPEIRRLNLFNSINIDINIQTILPITLSNLTDISIPMTHVKFDEFEIFIKKIDAKLKFLRVSIQSEDIDFLNACRWENLILKSLPQLEEFYFRYSELVDDEYKYPEGLNQFTSSFWIERKWIFEAEIIGESINYLIRPYRKRWYEYLNSSFECSESTRLTITPIYPYKLVRKDTKRVLTTAQIYHLEILKEKVHIGALVKAVNLLPKLNTLKIHSLSLYEPRMLNFEEIILSQIEDTSEITKVYLEKMNEIKQLDFLFELCPYMEELKMDYIKHMDFKFVLRYIIKKIKDDDNDYLRLLCFSIPTADDEIIKKLKRMIRFEKLLLNYTIKRVADKIYLEWQ